MILVIGSINMDIVFGVKEIPAPGETVLASGTRKSPGGKGANQAVAAARLGGDVVMLGCVGQDAYGEELMASMESAGVKTRYLLRTRQTGTSCAYICVSQAGENCIVVDSSANMLVSPEYIEAHEDLFSQAEYCILQLEIPVETVRRAMELSKKHGVKVIFNPSPLSAFDASLLQGVDYVIPNEVEGAQLLEGRALTEENWQDLMQRCQIRNVIMTAGKLGACHYTLDGKAAHYPAQPRKPVDTTGAGDTFLGAFAAAICSGRSHGEAISFANRASGIAVTRSGAQSAMPTLAEMTE